MRRLFDKRWPLSGASDHLVSEALYLDDPDGLGIEIYRDRPRAEWPISNGQLAMATDPLDLQSVYDEPGAESALAGLDINGDRPCPPACAASRYGGAVVLQPHWLRAHGAGVSGRVVCRGGRVSSPSRIEYLDGGRRTAAPENAVGLRTFTIEAGSLGVEDVVDPDTRVTVKLCASS